MLLLSRALAGWFAFQLARVTTIVVISSTVASPTDGFNATHDFLWPCLVGLALARYHIWMLTLARVKLRANPEL